MLNVVIHATGVACFGFALYYDLVHVKVPAHLAASAAFASMRAFPGKWKYLTVWDLVLQFVYHSVSLVNDLCGSNELTRKRQSTLQKFRDGLFASWAFPVGLFVSITFWGLYAIDRALVFPKELDIFYPTWLNHAVHTGPITLMTLELLAIPKLLPGRNKSLLGNLGFSMTYLACVTFWVMFILDRELVFPVLLDTFIPLWLNHAMHTAPALFVLGENVLVGRTYPRPFVGVTILVGGVSIYLSWITWVYTQSGVWAYPILEILSNEQRGGFFGCCTLSIVGLYYLGEKISSWRWGTSVDDGSEETTSKARGSGKGKKKSKLT